AEGAATLGIAWPVAGLYVSKEPPSTGSSHSLLMSSFVCRMAGVAERFIVAWAMASHLYLGNRKGKSDASAAVPASRTSRGEVRRRHLRPEKDEVKTAAEPLRYRTGNAIVDFAGST